MDNKISNIENKDRNTLNSVFSFMVIKGSITVFFAFFFSTGSDLCQVTEPTGLKSRFYRLVFIAKVEVHFSAEEDWLLHNIALNSRLCL